MSRSPALQNRVAVVTGASRGIGRAIAEKLASTGARLVLHGRTPRPEMDSLVQLLQSQSVDVQTMYADFSCDVNHTAIVDDAWQRFGRVDHWINNAGGDVLTGNMTDQSFEEKLDYLWRTDVVTTLQFSRIAGARMAAQQSQQNDTGNCSVLNMGWDQAAWGMSGDAGEMFATTKGAIMAMTRSLAQSLAPQVRVNCLAPGWVQTAWGEQASEYWHRRAQSDSLMQRWGTPADVADTAVYACTHNFVSGQILQVNGGFRFGQGERI